MTDKPTPGDRAITALLGHSPEPWKWSKDEHGVCLYRGEGISAEYIAGNGDQLLEDDARRIVACVNACAGLTTEYLEQGPLLIHDAAEADVQRRITACYKVCDGIPTDRLEKSLAESPTGMGMALLTAHEFVKENTLLKSQRDTLLAAIKAIDDLPLPFASECFKIAREAIAKIEKVSAGEPQDRALAVLRELYEALQTSDHRMIHADVFPPKEIGEAVVRLELAKRKAKALLENVSAGGSR